MAFDGEIETSLRPRARSAVETRSRILGAARTRFCGEGYDHVGLRDIAADAGVDPALIVRYFGSKEELFAAVMAGAFVPDELFGGERHELGERLVREIMNKPESEGRGCAAHPELDPLKILTRSLSSPTAAERVAASFDADFIESFVERFGGENARARAGIFAAQLIGLAILRLVLRSGALTTADTELAVSILGKAMQACIDPPKDSG